MSQNFASKKYGFNITHQVCYVIRYGSRQPFSENWHNTVTIEYGFINKLENKPCRFESRIRDVCS